MGPIWRILPRYLSRDPLLSLHITSTSCPGEKLPLRVHRDFGITAILLSDAKYMQAWRIDMIRFSLNNYFTAPGKCSPTDLERFQRMSQFERQNVKHFETLHYYQKSWMKAGIRLQNQIWRYMLRAFDTRGQQGLVNTMPSCTPTHLLHTCWTLRCRYHKLLKS